jgi:RHS repeat-associated protein
MSGTSTYASYTYDLAGNQTTRSYPGTGEAWDYVYDGKNQLRRVTRKLNGNVTGSEEYWYDGDGEREIIVKRDANGAKTEMIWFIGDTEAHYDPAGTPTQAYAHVTMGTPVARLDRHSDAAATVEYQFHGLANNTLAAIDQSTGATNASFVYAPFGELVEATDDGGPAAGIAKHRRRMNDKFVDEIGDLAYYGARYYDSTSMSWTQADPLYQFFPDVAIGSTPRRANLYQFSLNNPLRYVDPDGRDSGYWTRGSQAELDFAMAREQKGATYGGGWMAPSESSEAKNCGASAPGICDPAQAESPDAGGQQQIAELEHTNRQYPDSYVAQNEPSKSEEEKYREAKKYVEEYEKKYKDKPASSDTTKKTPPAPTKKPDLVDKLYPNASEEMKQKFRKLDAKPTKPFMQTMTKAYKIRHDKKNAWMYKDPAKAKERKLQDQEYFRARANCQKLPSCR